MDALGRDRDCSFASIVRGTAKLMRLRVKLWIVM
jgi:hypothetical protein